MAQRARSLLIAVAAVVALCVASGSASPAREAGPAFSTRNVVSTLLRGDSDAVVTMDVLNDDEALVDDEQLDYLHSALDFSELPSAVVPLARSEAPAAESLIEEEARVPVNGNGCKAGFACVWETGVCCEGGEVCCQYACKKNVFPPRCTLTDQQMALLLARKKMELEAKQEIQQEQNAKASSETGQKTKQEITEKQKQEVVAKEKAKQSEQRKKKQDADAEDAQKKDATQREQQNKAQYEKEKQAQEVKEKAAEQRSKVTIVIADNYAPVKGTQKAAAKLLPAGDERTIMFWVRPNGVQPQWSNILQKGANNGERDPAIFLYPNSLRLHVRSGTDANANDGLDPAQPLQLHVWTHITVMHSKAGMQVWMNGKKVIEAKKGGPISNNGPLYVSNPWHDPALVTISDLRWMRRIPAATEVIEQMNKKAYTEIKSNEVILLDVTRRVRKNSIIANNAIISKCNSQTWMFWIMPMGIIPTRGSILHKGAADQQQNPAIYFLPGRTRLHIRSSTRRGWNDGPDDDPQADLVPFEWTHVAITHTEGNLFVYFNGNQVVRASGIPAPLTNDGPLYMGAPWYDAAMAQVADVRYVDSALDINDIKKVFFQRKYQPFLPKVITVIDNQQKVGQGRQVATHDMLDDDVPAYTYSFWLKLNSINGGWTNIIHKGLQDGQRNPAIFVYPGQSRLHCRSGVSGQWNEGCDPAVQLPLHQWAHVAFVHMHTRMEVFINGKSQCKEFRTQPTPNAAPLYASNPWYPTADATIADLRMIRGPIDANRVAEIMAEKKDKLS